MKGILSGREVAKVLHKEVSEELEGRGDTRAPGLVVILVGEDPASKRYTRNKAKLATKLGIKSETLQYPETITEDELLDKIDELNNNSEVDGILVQLPLPSHINPNVIQQAILPDKDVDGFHAMNLGMLMQNEPGLRPCTPQGIMRLLEYYEIPLQGTEAVVMGRSNIVGKPMAQMLTHADCSVTLLHSKSKNRERHLEEAELIVVAIGQPENVKIDELSNGQVVIDVGIHPGPDGKLVGDVEKGAEEKVRITPVPGGVGPLTVAQLMKNCVIAWKNHTGQE